MALPDDAARDGEGPGRGENGGIHVFSKHLQFLDYDEMAEKAAEISFDGVDLSVRPGGHVHPERVEDDLPRAAEAVGRAGLVLPMMVTAITDPRDPHTEPILRTASALGIREYRMGYLRYDAKAGIAERLDSFVAPLRELAAMNAEIGLHANYQIHETLRNKRTEHTADGKLAYYLDMNGRYEAKDTLLRLLDHARAIGAFDHIIVVEEPFPEHADIDVGDIDVLIAADESAHTDEDVLERIEMGYGAIALKAIAKTLSMTMKMAQVAYEHDVPCFCADLTVNPILVEWNKMVAARLAPIPGFEVGLLETNGHQNYANWRTMET